MAYQTSMVKDLAIALEAVSRINTEGSQELYSTIAYCLDLAMNKVKKELCKPDEDETTTADNHDDIPF